jgi:hypothetical protein
MKMNGPKSPKYVSLAPDGFDPYYVSNAIMFLEKKRNTWEHLNFGKLMAIPTPDREGGMFAAIIQNLTTDEFLYSYYKLLPTIGLIVLTLASLIANSLQRDESQQVIVYLFNPFENETLQILDLTMLFVRLLSFVADYSHHTIEEVKRTIILEIVSTRKLHKATSGLFEESDDSLKKMCFKTYDRLKSPVESKGDRDKKVFVSAPAYHLKITNEPLASFSVEGLQPLLPLEPDRIVYLTFGMRCCAVYAVWNDASLELTREEFIILEDTSNASVVSELLFRTTKYFGSAGFKVRLVVICVDGWTYESRQGIFE